MRRQSAPSQPTEEKVIQSRTDDSIKSPFQFELYTGRTSRLGEVFITVEATGRISVSSGAGRIFGNPEAVLMLFDRTKNVIAMRSASLSASHALKVSARMGSSEGRACGFVVSAIGFCHQYQIPTSSSQRYQAEMYDGMLIADLNKPL